MSAEQMSLGSVDGKGKEGKPFFGEKEVNGIIINVRWESESQDYEIYFPQIQLGNTENVPDQVLRITRDAEVAKKVFDRACELALQEPNVYKLYKAIQEFSRNLPY